MNRDIYNLLAFLLLAIVIGGLMSSTGLMEGFTGEVTQDIHVENRDWRKFVGMWEPQQNPADYVLKSDPLYTNQGTPNPIASQAEPQILNNPEGPSVNGTENGKKSMSMFAFNHSDPKCCYGMNGGYSTSGGCVCVTPQQQKFLAQVGNNRAGGYLGI